VTPLSDLTRSEPLDGLFSVYEGADQSDQSSKVIVRHANEQYGICKASP
jgi:hypothetical protein